MPSNLEIEPSHLDAERLEDFQGPVLLEDFEQNGFAIVRSVFRPSELDRLFVDLPNLQQANASRSLFKVRNFRNLAVDPRMTDIIKAVHGGTGWPIRGILFDKTVERNWAFDWHQDTKITVRERVDIPGYVDWSLEEGVLHCKPPQDILTGMLALRISLDIHHEHNGPIRFLPGSHRHGILSQEAIREWDKSTEVSCLTDVGDVVLMHPLIVHASKESTTADRRRVLHFEYATKEIDPNLLWAFA